jgi:general secretion pathway protein G
MCAKRSKRGFTLVEILIVVVILGILASIVVGQFRNVTSESQKAALSDQLHHIRTQIQLYTLQHNDARPTLTGGNWDSLVVQHLHNGERRGPYLPSIPRNTLNDFTNVLVVAADPSFGDPVAGANIGFVYNPSNGFVWGTNTAGDKIYNEANPNDPGN